MTKGLHKDSLRKVDNPHQWMIDDARMGLIQQIKAEVERRIKRNKEEYAPDGLFEVQDNLAKLLSFLSNLDLEKPTIQEQPVKIDIRKELASIEFMGVNDARDTETIARHFYALGQQSKEQPVCEDK